MVKSFVIRTTRVLSLIWAVWCYGNINVDPALAPLDAHQLVERADLLGWYESLDLRHQNSGVDEIVRKRDEKWMEFSKGLGVLDFEKQLSEYDADGLKKKYIQMNEILEISFHYCRSILGLEAIDLQNLYGFLRYVRWKAKRDDDRYMAAGKAGAANVIPSFNSGYETEKWEEFCAALYEMSDMKHYLDAITRKMNTIGCDVPSVPFREVFLNQSNGLELTNEQIFSKLRSLEQKALAIKYYRNCAKAWMTEGDYDWKEDLLSAEGRLVKHDTSYLKSRREILDRAWQKFTDGLTAERFAQKVESLSDQELRDKCAAMGEFLDATVIYAQRVLGLPKNTMKDLTWLGYFLVHLDNSDEGCMSSSVPDSQTCLELARVFTRVIEAVPFMEALCDPVERITSADSELYFGFLVSMDIEPGGVLLNDIDDVSKAILKVINEILSKNNLRVRKQCDTKWEEFVDGVGLEDFRRKMLKASPDLLVQKCNEINDIFDKLLRCSQEFLPAGTGYLNLIDFCKWLQEWEEDVALDGPAYPCVCDSALEAREIILKLIDMFQYMPAIRFPLDRKIGGFVAQVSNSSPWLMTSKQWEDARAQFFPNLKISPILSVGGAMMGASSIIEYLLMAERLLLIIAGMSRTDDNRARYEDIKDGAWAKINKASYFYTSSDVCGTLWHNFGIDARFDEWGSFNDSELEKFKNSLVNDYNVLKHFYSKVDEFLECSLAHCQKLLGLDDRYVCFGEFCEFVESMARCSTGLDLPNLKNNEDNCRRLPRSLEQIGSAMKYRDLLGKKLKALKIKIRESGSEKTISALDLVKKSALFPEEVDLVTFDRELKSAIGNAKIIMERVNSSDECTPHIQHDLDPVHGPEARPEAGRDKSTLGETVLDEIAPDVGERESKAVGRGVKRKHGDDEVATPEHLKD